MWMNGLIIDKKIKLNEWNFVVEWMSSTHRKIYLNGGKNETTDWMRLNNERGTKRNNGNGTKKEMKIKEN